jgi:hypothetical protein
VIPDSWFQFFYRAILIQPSSCSVERVFFIFKQMFDDNQRSSLNDAISLGVSIRFNDLRRNRLNKLTFIHLYISILRYHYYYLGLNIGNNREFPTVSLDFNCKNHEKT